ncbi:MAG TPA: hypothetical protein DDX98_14585 [Bacteroidales bacterium]|jgi:hypothetical protein|nr:hypothetical protein [Bacteroidales bacterium]
MGFLDKLKKYDIFWIGLILGIALPLLLYPILRPLDPKNFAFISADYHKAMLKMLPMLLSRCVFPNALLFFLFIWNRFDKIAKGVLYSTVGITAVLIVIQIIF